MTTLPNLKAFAPFSPTFPLSQHCWREQIPDWTGPALEQLYGNLYATLTQFRLSHDLQRAHTYAAFQGGELQTLFIFAITHGVVEVYNEVICLSPGEIEAFSRYIFCHFGEARVVAFRAIHVAQVNWLYPSQQYDYLEDTWIALPVGTERYTASLSKNTRRNVRRYSQNLQEEQPGYLFRITEKTEVDLNEIDTIIALNHARMANMNKLSALDAQETARLKQLAGTCGLVGSISIDGHVCAGAISYNVGNNYFLIVLAHDPAYDRYSLGFLCCYLTICACIERGGKEFHFLWGRYDYKRSFLGEQRSLDQLLLYRSHSAMCRHASLALRTWLKAIRRRTVLWLQTLGRSEHPAARLALRYHSALRRLRWRI